jgi:hypothetical protein
MVDADGTHIFAIHEVHFDDAGGVTGYTENPAWTSGETYKELTEDFVRYQAAFARPVIAVEPDGGIFEIGPIGNSAPRELRAAGKE